jgi:hypothetical protein
MRKRFWLLILLAIGSRQSWAQQVLLRPTLSSALGSAYNGFMDLRLTGNTEAIAVNAALQVSLAKQKQLLFCYTLGSNWDTLDLNHGSLSQKTFELGWGNRYEKGPFFSQNAITFGHQYSKYRYYDTLQTIQRFETYQVMATMQYAAGYRFRSLEMGVTARMIGFYNYFQRVDETRLHGDAISAWQKSKSSTNSLSIEPGAFVNLIWEEEWALSFNIAAPMHRSGQNEFAMPKEFIGSLGLRLYI